MKKSFKLLGIIILSLLLIPAISARSSDVFIDYLTDLMWNDCKGKDIHINQNIINYTRDNQTSVLRLVKWPYNTSLGVADNNRNVLRRIIEIFGEEQHNFSTFYGTCDNKGVTISGIDGCGILTCGDNRLDINGYNYFWNSEKVDVPKEELLYAIASGNNNSQIINKGEGNFAVIGNNNVANTGENSDATQQILSFNFPSFALGAILTGIASVLLQWWQKKKRGRAL